MNNFFLRFQQFASNPVQFLMQNKLNIPQQYMQSPEQTIQYLMDSGRLTQAQYNQVKQQARQLESNPQFKQFIQQLQQNNPSQNS